MGDAATEASGADRGSVGRTFHLLFPRQAGIHGVYRCGARRDAACAPSRRAGASRVGPEDIVSGIACLAHYWLAGAGWTDADPGVDGTRHTAPVHLHAS